MNNTAPPSELEQQLREMNEALLVSSVRQHELAEQVEKAGAALRRSEHRYRRLFEAAQDGVLIIDPATRKILEANPYISELLGYTRDELLGKELFEIGLLKDEAASRTSFRELMEKGSIRYENLPLQTKTGERLEVEMVSSLYEEDGENIIQYNVRGITDRKEHEAKLRASEERYHDLFASSPMAVFVCDKNAVIQQYNRVAAELWGRVPVVGVEQHCGSVKLWLPDGTFLPHEQSPMVEVLRTGVPARNVEVYIERPDGSRLPVLVNFAALKDARGEITGAITSFMDINERKQAEEALAESEARKSAMVSSALDGIITIDHEGTILEFNPAAEEMFGSRREEVLGREMAELIIPPPLRGRHRAGLARYMATGDGPILGLRLELTALRSSGAEFPVEVAITRINTAGPPLFTGYIRDITERKRAEASLRESEHRLRFIMDSAPQKIFTATSNGEVDYFNPIWMEFTGLSFEYIKGWGWKQFIHPDDVEENVRLWQHSIDTGAP